MRCLASLASLASLARQTHLARLMQVLGLCTLLGTWACAVGEADDSPDCAALTRLRNECGVELGAIEPGTCGHVLYFLSPSCRGALHRYLTCAATKPCPALADPKTCSGLDQAVAVACAGGAAQVTTDPNASLHTIPRTSLGTR